MKNHKRERSLLYSSFREEFRAATDKNSFHRTLDQKRSTSSCPSVDSAPTKNTPFKFLADSGLEKLLPYLEIRHVQAGETIWQQGEPCRFMVFIDRGKVKITKRTEFDTNQLVIAVLGNGKLAGDFSMFEKNLYPTTATAMEYSLLGILDLERFQEVLGKEPDLGICLLKEMLNSVSTQLRQSINRLIHLF